jgi:ADP-ribose pyrophosphatase
MPDTLRPPEEQVARNWIYLGKIISLSVDTVRLASGREATREIVHHPGAVAAVPLDNSGQVILVRQFRYATGQALLEIPAGCLNPDESPEECLQRELAEEIGQAAGRVDKLITLYPSPGCLNEVLHLYLARELTPATGQPDEDEDLELVTMPLAEAIDRCRRGEICDAKSVTGLLLARELLESE